MKKKVEFKQLTLSQKADVVACVAAWSSQDIPEVTLYLTKENPQVCLYSGGGFDVKTNLIPLSAA